MQDLAAEHVYIKWFDINWIEQHQQPGPIAVLQASDNIKYLFTIPNSPVVFINNTVFNKIDSTAISRLANNLYEAIYNKSILLSAYTGLSSEAYWHNIQEIQIDCDWTPRTKNKYFYFLHLFKSALKEKTLSITLRLYPYKYQQKMGIPPADKAILMSYNMDQIKNIHTRNSIFDPAVLQQYLTVDNYPLPLEVALPTFGWYVWFRNNNFMGIVYAPELAQINSVIHKEKDSNWLIVQDKASSFNYFKAGDRLRPEFPSKEALLKGWKMLKKQHPAIKKIHYFYLDDYTYSTYEDLIKTIHHL